MALHVERVADPTVETAGVVLGRPVGVLRRLRGPAVLALSVLAPVVLVVGVLFSQAVQRAGGYDPVRQTVSTLAGRGAADRWFMTGTLIALGVIYLLIVAGLCGAPRSARLLLGLGAGSVIATALAPQPAVGSSTVHMAAMVIGCIAFVAWPLGLAADHGLDPRLRRGSLGATAAMTVALGWLCAQAWTHGTWLGVAERVLLLAQTVWPIRVALASWRMETGLGERPPRTEQVTLALTLLSPVVFPVGLVAAQAAQPAVDPLAFSLSTLAGLGATNRWIMTVTLLFIGVTDVLVATGLRQVPNSARLLLGAGGTMLVAAALFPQPAGGSSTAHMVTGGVAWAAFSAWPLALACSSKVERRLRWTSAVASGVLLVLLVWFVVQMITEGTWYGISQRIVFAAQSIWPIRMAVRATRVRGRSSGGAPGPPQTTCRCTWRHS